MKTLLDYLPIIIFFYFYKTTDPKDNQHPILQTIGSAGNTDQNHILVATAALLIATLVVYGCLFIFQKFKLEKMQWFIVISSIIFGGITLALSDVTYIKLKAVIINAGVGSAFLFSAYFTKDKQPVIRKMFDPLLSMDEKGWHKLNLAWCGQFLILAILHILFGFVIAGGKYWGEFTAFGDIIFSLSYLGLMLFSVRKYFKKDISS
ncbi:MULTISPECIES: septation protein IspZ [unclassified Acinetobacter]|uniref:septation protein IspZ n=1 Tax=unclassified Acinetobacter TaxID=196816 RepID=UPI0035BA701B